MKQSLKSRTLRIAATMLVFMLAFSLFACQGNNGGNTSDKGSSSAVTGVEFDTYSLNLEIGDEATLGYIVLPADADTSNAKWMSSRPSVATVEDIGGGQGKVTAVGEGTATIRVTVGGKSANCTVTVTDPSKLAVDVTSIALDTQLVRLEIGGTHQLTATVLPDNATDKSVKWESYSTQVATVDNNGFVTAVGNGRAIIRATASNKMYASCVVVVGEASTPTDPNALYVAKIPALENRNTKFIMAMDASAVPSIEAAREENGLSYRNFDGEPEDVFKILQDNGITDIRIRIWNDPKDANGNWYGGGNCDLNNALEICERCEKLGLGVIIDFHYSDFWADPGKQTLPKAWKGLDTNQVANEIYKFTKESMQAIVATGVTVTMVQIGNETTSGFCGANGWDVNQKTICNYINQGSKAVREVTGAVADGGAKVAVHFTNPESGGYGQYANMLEANEVDYDVFGSSYYPFWHGTLENLGAQLANVHNYYGKEVMVLETSYPFTAADFDGYGNTWSTKVTEPLTVQGQANAVANVIKTVANLGDWGLGVAYWEGTWIAASASNDSRVNVPLCTKYGCGWANAAAAGYDSDANNGGCVIDNQAFFDSNGYPLESLKVFSLVYNGVDVALTVDSAESQERYFTVNVGSIELPSTATVTLNDGSVLTTEVFWEVTDDELAEYIAKAGEYTVHGTTRYGGDCICLIYVSNPNLLKDYSFEESQGYTQDGLRQAPDQGGWQMDYNMTTEQLQLYVSNESQNAKPGKQSFHFWDAGIVNFKLWQEVSREQLNEYGNGKYTASFDVQGGDGSGVNVHAYIILVHNDGHEETVDGTVIGFNGWENFTRTSVTATITDDIKMVKVGISVYSGMAGNGPWGNIDNCQFYYVG